MSTKINPPKLGAPLQPGEGNDATTIVLIEPRDDGDAGEFGAQVTCEGLTIDLDPAILVDAGRRAWLKHGRESVLTGQKIDGSGPVKKLGARAAEAPGRQSDFRLYKTGTLADGLYSGPISSDGQTASATIKPPKERVVIVAKEKARGNNLMTTDGAAGEVVLEAMRQAAEAMLTGRKVMVKTGAVDADEVKS